MYTSYTTHISSRFFKCDLARLSAAQPSFYQGRTKTGARFSSRRFLAVSRSGHRSRALNEMSENKQKPPRIKIIAAFDEDKNTALHFAAARGDVDEIATIIENGHKVDPTNYLDWTPLMMATRNGHLDAVKALIENRADATRKNKFGATVFLMAVTTGNLNLIHLILEHLLCGGVSKQCMETNFSPVSFAVLFGWEHVVKYLLEKSFGVDCETSRTGLTPLMFTAAVENTNLMALLIQSQAAVSIRNVNQQTAHDILQLKQRKLPQIPQVHHRQPPQLSPLLYVSPQPCLHMTQNQMQRKSSDLISPNYFFSPHFTTPVSPISFLPQVFFPPDFSAPQYFSPLGNFYGPNEILNARIAQNSPYVSAMPPSFYQVYSPPCPNSYY